MLLLKSYIFPDCRIGLLADMLMLWANTAFFSRVQVLERYDLCIINKLFECEPVCYAVYVA